MAGVLSQLWAKLSEGWGERMGYTSFEVKTTTEEIVKLKNKMIKCINSRIQFKYPGLYFLGRCL